MIFAALLLCSSSLGRSTHDTRLPVTGYCENDNSQSEDSILSRDAGLAVVSSSEVEIVYEVRVRALDLKNGLEGPWSQKTRTQFECGKVEMGN